MKTFSLYSEKNLPSTSYPQPQFPISHYLKQHIQTQIPFQSQVFSPSMPSLHRLYLFEICKAYNGVVPFRIKMIDPQNNSKIEHPNYFSTQQSSSFLCYCIPKSNRIGFYCMADACRSTLLTKDYYQQRKLQNEWVFSPDTKAITTPIGKTYAIHCRTTPSQIDKYLYEITDNKASTRAAIPIPRRECSFIYLNNAVYIVGGFAEGEKCTRKGYKYDFKTKKWINMGEANVAVTKPTLCVFNFRFIVKVGGMNQFDYINKVIEVYDTHTDKWHMVRAFPKNILDQVQILEDSLAVQINANEIYVFGGKNSNRYATDTAFILMITEIKEKKGGINKVTGEYFKVGAKKINILSFFGVFSQSNVVVHNNSIYVLRAEQSKLIAI